MATIRNAGITGDFIHEPLRDPHNEIRLVLIQASEDRNHAVECTVSTYALPEAPPYVAISYTWGDMTKKCMIRINDKEIRVGYNSWLVLWQARLHRIAQYLWIDILSIDQANDYEKSIQVGLMGTIYQTATFVCASVGAHVDDSEFLANQIRLHIEYIKRKRTLRGEMMDSPPDTLLCSTCERPLRPLLHVCEQCGATVKVCRECESTQYHEHNTYSRGTGREERQDWSSTGFCDQCDRQLTGSWYQSKDEIQGGAHKMCKSCAQTWLDGTDTSSWVFQSTLTDKWGDINGPASPELVIMQEELQSSTRIYELSQESHQRLIDAFWAFSLRPYFTRLWRFIVKIVQEVRRARHVVIACGTSMYDFREFRAIADDLDIPPNPRDDHVRWRCDSLKHPQVSPYLEKILQSGAASDASLWGLVRNYRDSACTDPRDLVFGLLALADDHASRVIHPDYTKSDTSVLLQLLEAHASSINMETAFDIVAAFRLGPYNSEIAALLQQRRKTSCTNSTSLSLACRNANHLTSASRVSAKAHSYCKVWQDITGVLIAPLTKAGDLQLHANHAFQIGQETVNEGVGIHTPSGLMVAVANRDLQPGDVLLFFCDTDDSDDPDEVLQTPLPGLIVRPAGGDTHTIVGQFLFGQGVRPCAGMQYGNATYLEEDGPRRGRCECLNPDALGMESSQWLSMNDLDRQSPEGVVVFSGVMEWDRYHNGSDRIWSVHMSPEDLLLFVAQDLKVEENPLEKDLVPRAGKSMYPEETVRRLTTDVTSDGFSSYAVCERSESDAGWLGAR